MDSSEHPHPSCSLPDRIWVVGLPGSGKSTLTAALAARQGVAPVHLDDLHWLPGWVERPDAELDAALARIVAGPRWVIDGNYTRHRMRHLDAIQLHVWLDLPLRVTLPRLLRRGLRRSLHREPCCNGNYESLRRTFLHKDSLLLWALQTQRGRRRALAAETAARPHVRLRSPSEIERWMAGLGGRG